MATVVGIGCCFLGAVLHGFCKRNQREAEALESVTRVKQLKDLEDRLSQIVTFSGEVAADELLKCKRSGLEGAVVEEEVLDRVLVKRIYLKKPNAWTTQKHKEESEDNADGCRPRDYPCRQCKNVASDNPVILECVDCGLHQVIEWVEEKREVSSTRNEVPWFLDDGTGRVRIVGVRLEPTVRKEGSEDANPDRALIEDAIGCLKGGKTMMRLGIKWIDRVCPVGESITVVGEVYKDNEGAFCVRRPKDGPYHVAYGKTIDDLTADYKKSAKRQKSFSRGCIVFGLGLISADIIQLGIEKITK